MTTLDIMLSEALLLAERGWQVFPCNPKDKTPLVGRDKDEHGEGIPGTGGLLKATTDPKLIEQWWRKWPRAMIGIRTGPESGFFVVDLDIDQQKKRDGITELGALANGHEVPETIITQTPRGGRHLFFKWVDGIKNSESKIANGVDVRGQGGYVIAPPSRRADGVEYQFIVDCPDGPADAPPWLLEFLLEKQETERQRHDDGKRGDAYAEKALDNECANVANAATGTRNATLNRAAFSLGQLVGGGLLDEGRVRSRLTDAAVQCGLVDDDGNNAADRTIKSGLDAGKAEPRRAPHDARWQERRDDIPAATTTTEEAWPQRSTGSRADSPPDIYSVDTLRTEVFPTLKQIAGEIIVEGLTLLASRPKIGKTWLALDVAIAVAEGTYCLGDIRCEPGDVLFLALEDNKRRMQRRLTKLLGINKAKWPRFACSHKWPRANAGGLQRIRDWIAKADDPRLIVIDVLARFRKPVPPGKQSYDADYETIAELQGIASDTGVGIVVIHHTRKGEADDPLDAVSGTLGLAGAADAVLVIDRKPQGTRLYGRSRDVDEIDKALMFSRETCRWTILGETADVRRSKERQQLLDALADGPLALKDIAKVVGKPTNTVFNLLEKMARGGEVIRTSYGRYARPATPDGSDGRV